MKSKSKSIPKPKITKIKYTEKTFDQLLKSLVDTHLEAGVNIRSIAAILILEAKLLEARPLYTHPPYIGKRPENLN